MSIPKIRLNLKSFIWLIPFFSGIICLISVITPAGYSLTTTIYFTENRNINFWIWGIWISNQLAGGGFGTYNIVNTVLVDLISLIIGIAVASIIFLSGVILILKSVKLRNDPSLLIKNKKIWLILGCILLIGTIGWLIQISFLNYYNMMYRLFRWDSLGSPPDPEYFNAFFWGYFKMDFGVIGPLIAGSVLIFSYLLIKR